MIGDAIENALKLYEQYGYIVEGELEIAYKEIQELKDFKTLAEATIFSYDIKIENQKKKLIEISNERNELSKKLLEYKQKCMELDNENKHKTKMVHFMMDSVGLRYKNYYVSELTEELEKLKEDAELGKILNLAMTKQQIGEIDICINDMVININTYDGVLTLEEWYNKNKGGN